MWWILGNPVYKGVIRYNDDFEVDGENEAIIDEELFDEVPRKLEAEGPSTAEVLPPVIGWHL